MHKLKASYKFDSAHFIPNCNSKCENIHGHTWTATFEIIGYKDKNGMVVDFSVLKEMVNELDHGCGSRIYPPIKQGDGWFIKNIINDIIPIPTAENIAEYLYNKVIALDNVDSCVVSVEESPGKSAIYPV